jgi:hypothetical protein
LVYRTLGHELDDELKRSVAAQVPKSKLVVGLQDLVVER